MGRWSGTKWFNYKKEIKNYKNKYFDIQDDNLLEFWKNQKPNFSLLCILTNQILVSSASSEQTFSVARKVIEERRSCSGGSTVDDILFLNNYFKS